MIDQRVVDRDDPARGVARRRVSLQPGQSLPIQFL
jgi:hypothetical protein